MAYPRLCSTSACCALFLGTGLGSGSQLLLSSVHLQSCTPKQLVEAPRWFWVQPNTSGSAVPGLLSHSRTSRNGAGASGLGHAAETTWEPQEPPGKGCPAREEAGDAHRCQPWSWLCSILCKNLLFWCRISVGQRLCPSSEPCCGLVGYHWARGAVSQGQSKTVVDDVRKMPGP